MVLDVTNVSTVAEYGNDIMSKMREASRKASLRLEDKSDNKDILRSLSRIFDNIDYAELKFLNTPQGKGFARIVDFITKKKEKLLGKYTSITEELDKMYINVKQWECNLRINNDVLTELGDSITKIKEELGERIEVARLTLTQADDVPTNVEGRSILMQKIQDLEYNLAACEQELQNIEVKLRTNYSIYRKLISVYDSELPIIQTQVSMFKVTKEHHEMAEILSVLDEKKVALLKFGTEETIATGKKTAEMLGYKLEDFQLMQDLVDKLKAGTEEIAQIEATRIDRIQSELKRIEGGKLHG